MKTPDTLTTKQQIHNALEQLLVLFVKNNEYGDVDGLLDDTPFMPLFISLKKSVYEKLLTLAMQNEEIEEEELAALQEKTNIIWKGNAFSFPPLSAFATKEHIFRFCNFDLERFHQYLSDIEDTLLCTSYSQVIELLNYDKLYGLLSDIEKKQFLKVFVEEVQIFPDVQPDGKFLRSIKFGFPIPYDGSEVQAISWDKENTVETVALLEKGAAK